MTLFIITPRVYLRPLYLASSNWLSHKSWSLGCGLRFDRRGNHSVLYPHPPPLSQSPLSLSTESNAEEVPSIHPSISLIARNTIQRPSESTQKSFIHLPLTSQV